MNIKVISRSFYAGLSIFFCLVFITTYKYANLIMQEKDVRINKLKSLQVADILRQSSDDLTRLSRTFTITGNPEFEREYWEVYNIRSGKQYIPERYHGIYWDLVSANPSKKPRPDTSVKQSIVEIIKNLAHTNSELAKLNSSFVYSEKLAKLELQAINATKGIFKDINGNYSIHKKPDLKYARDLLHSKDYHIKKAKVSKPLDEFFAMFEARLNNQIELLQLQSSFYLKILISEIFLLILFLIPGYYSLTKIIKSQLDDLNTNLNKDALTKLYNRLATDNFLKNEKNKIKQDELYNVGIIIGNIDEFGVINDLYGHLIGDEILLNIADILKTNSPADAFISRWDGDEFMIVLPNYNIDKAYKLAKTLRFAIERYYFDVVGKKTMSFGVGVLTKDQSLIHDLKDINVALYRAKEAGKNKTRKVNFNLIHDNI